MSIQLSIQDWGAVGEIVGAVGIIVTLLYLAAQIRYARLASVDATRQNRVAAIRDIERQIMLDPRVSSAWDKVTEPSFGPAHGALADAYDLSRDEAMIVFRVAASWMWTHWAQYHSLKSRSDQEELERLVRVFYTVQPMDLFITLPFVREHFDPAFWTWMDAVLAEVSRE